MTRKKGQRKGRGRAVGEVVSLGSVFKSALLATPIALATGVLLILLVAALLSGTEDPDKYHTVSGLFLIYLTALLGGTVATRLHHRQTPLFCGMATAALLLLLLLILSLISPGSGHAHSTALQTGLYALLFPAAVAGAFLGAHQKRGRARRRGARR